MKSGINLGRIMNKRINKMAFNSQDASKNVGNNRKILTQAVIQIE